MKQICEGLWQGNREDAIACVKVNQVLEPVSESIDAIIYLGQEMHVPDLMYQAVLPIFHYPFNDGHNPPLKWERLMGLINGVMEMHDKPEVLVACRYGVSRSPTVCYAYLRHWLNLTHFSASLLINSNCPQWKAEPHLMESFYKFQDYLEELGRDG